MRAYVDSSVVLRIVLRAPDALRQWNSIDQYISSVLLRVECARTMERLRMVEKVPADRILEYRLTIQAITNDANLIAIDKSVIELAQGDFAAPLKALDAIHLGSALLWREQHRADFAFATHDGMLARAARAAGFEVLGT